MEPVVLTAFLNNSPAASAPYGNNGIPGQYDIQVGQSQIIVPAGGQGQNVSVGYQGNDGIDYSKMQHISNNNRYDAGARNMAQRYGYGSGFSDEGSNISIELGTDADVTNLERLWDNLANKYPDVLGKYQPFFSVDTPADGQGKELFHLRVGPVKSLDAGDMACSRLGRNGVFCSVVRTQ